MYIAKKRLDTALEQVRAKNLPLSSFNSRLLRHFPLERQILPD